MKTVCFVDTVRVRITQEETLSAASRDCEVREIYVPLKKAGEDGVLQDNEVVDPASLKMFMRDSGDGEDDDKDLLDYYAELANDQDEGF